MQPNQRIEIQLVDEHGSPVRLANVLPEIDLFYRGRLEKPRYRFELWATDADGRCAIRFEDLEMMRKLLGAGDLMDFNTPLTECDPVVEIRIPLGSEFEARRRLPWRESWWRPAWLTEWPANGCLAPIEPKRVELHDIVTRVEIAVSLPTDAG